MGKDRIMNKLCREEEHASELKYNCCVRMNNSLNF